MKVDEGLRIFLSRRHDDTGWAAKYLATAVPRSLIMV
jgi:hypothetical protein